MAVLTAVEARFVRLEYVAVYELRDADGDPVGEELPIRRLLGTDAAGQPQFGPLVARGKAVDELPQQLREHAAKVLAEVQAKAAETP